MTRARRLAHLWRQDVAHESAFHTWFGAYCKRNARRWANRYPETVLDFTNNEKAGVTPARVTPAKSN